MTRLIKKYLHEFSFQKQNLYRLHSKFFSHPMLKKQIDEVFSNQMVNGIPRSQI